MTVFPDVQTVLIVLLIILKKLIVNGEVFTLKRYKISRNLCKLVNRSSTQHLFKKLKNTLEKSFWIHPTVRIHVLLCHSSPEKTTMKRVCFIGLKKFLFKTITTVFKNTLLIIRNNSYGTLICKCKIRFLKIHNRSKF